MTLWFQSTRGSIWEVGGELSRVWGKEVKGAQYYVLPQHVGRRGRGVLDGLTACFPPLSAPGSRVLYPSSHGDQVPVLLISEWQLQFPASPRTCSNKPVLLREPHQPLIATELTFHSLCCSLCFQEQLPCGPAGAVSPSLRHCSRSHLSIAGCHVFGRPHNAGVGIPPLAVG